MAEGVGSGAVTVPAAELPQSKGQEPALSSSRGKGGGWTALGQGAVPGKDESSTKDCFSHPFWLPLLAPHHQCSLRRARSGSSGLCLGRTLALRASSPDRNANPGDL